MTTKFDEATELTDRAIVAFKEAINDESITIEERKAATYISIVLETLRDGTDDDTHKALRAFNSQVVDNNNQAQ